MKKIPLRIRYTIITSLFLLCSCTGLMILSNLSANRMMRNLENEVLAETVIPAETKEDIDLSENYEGTAFEMATSAKGHPMCCFKKKRQLQQGSLFCWEVHLLILLLVIF